MTGADEPADVSVIIPAWNDAASLQRCLDALMGQTVQPKEILVADNGSNPPMEDQIARLPANTRFVVETRPGSYAARNAAVAEATGAWLAFTDDDCIPHPDWIANGAAEAHGDEILAGRVRIFPRNPERPSWTERYEMQWGLRQDVAVRDGGYGVTANLWVPRRLMASVGPFRDDLQSGGDREWCNRATRAGHSLRFAPTVAIDHPARPRLRDLLKKTRRVQAGAMMLGDLSSEHQRGLGALLVRGTMPPIAHWRRLAREAPEIGRMDRCRIAAVHWAVKWTRMRTILRHRSPPQ